MSASKVSRVTFFLKVKTLLLEHIFRPLRLRRARRSKAPSGEPCSVSITLTAEVSLPPSPTSPTHPFPTTIERGSKRYCDLAQRLHKHLPPTLNWLGPEDVQLVGATPFSSGGSSDVWEGSSKHALVAVKSLRCYSSSKSGPAEVGIVSFYLQFVQLDWH